MVTEEDFKTHMYAELIDAISREDEFILPDAIASAEGEASGYLSRYDVEALMGAVEDDRDPTLLMYLKDMSIWHFITLSNAGNDLEFRRTRYNDAIDWLTKVQSGKVVPRNWPLAQEEGQDLFFHVSSQPKRATRW